MSDNELKQLLQETCPVLPGQEARAWASLKTRLAACPAPSSWSWLHVPAWRGWAVVAALLVAAVVAGNLILAQMHPLSLATASSQTPGIYATAFYSNSAKAQVVWLDGMEPATDKPTYLDPTAVIPGSGDSAQQPAGKPDSL